MGTPRIDRAAVIAAELTDAGVKAVDDSDNVIANLPCVLVQPPTLAFDLHHPHATAEWRLVALTHPPGNRKAAVALDELVDQVADLIPLESATPGSYVLAPGLDPMPCYVLTYRESL